MRTILITVILIFGFQSFTKADDIRDFEMEGISIGDSLLNHISKIQIDKLNKQFVYPNKQYYIFVIEKDESLCGLLRDKFGSQIQIINKDVLKDEENGISKNQLIVFDTLPYNISRARHQCTTTRNGDRLFASLVTD